MTPKTQEMYEKMKARLEKIVPEVELQKMAPGNDVVMRSNEVTAITIK